MRDFQHLSARQLVQLLVQVNAAIRLTRVPESSSDAMSEEERTGWEELAALAVMERRIVRELRRRRDRQQILSGPWLSGETNQPSCKQEAANGSSLQGLRIG